jgi:hypothetical protein
MRALMRWSIVSILAIALAPGLAWAAPTPPRAAPEGAQPLAGDRGVFATLCR